MFSEETEKRAIQKLPSSGFFFFSFYLLETVAKGFIHIEFLNGFKKLDIYNDHYYHKKVYSEEKKHHKRH